MAIDWASEILRQVHGLIGFTEEDPLQLLTCRLYAWCSEFGAMALGGRAGARRCAGWDGRIPGRNYASSSPIARRSSTAPS